MSIARLSEFCNSRILDENLQGCTGREQRVQLFKAVCSHVNTTLAISFKETAALFANAITALRAALRNTFRADIPTNSAKNLCHGNSTFLLNFSLFYQLSDKIYHFPVFIFCLLSFILLMFTILVNHYIMIMQKANILRRSLLHGG